MNRHLKLTIYVLLLLAWVCPAIQTQAQFDLQITEIWFGQSGADLTRDWFEITNYGDTSWTAAVDGGLWYDDLSADPGQADPLNDVASIAPGESAVFVIGTAADQTTFHNIWDPVTSGYQVGYVSGATLGQGGNPVEDAVNVWLGDPLGGGAIIDSESYGMTDNFDAQSWDVDLQEYSTVGNAAGAVATIALGGSGGDVPATGSPGSVVPPPPSPATVFASTSFESESTPPGPAQYFDTGDPLVDHDLANNPGEPPVESTLAGSGAAGDLGFEARFENTGDPAGLTGGEFVGITDFTFEPSPDGTSQQYLASDTNGKLILDFDPVNLTGIADAVVAFDYYLDETLWTADNGIEAYVTIDGNTVVPVLTAIGDDINTNFTEDEWQTVSVDLSGLGNIADLTIEFKSEAEAMIIIVDNVRFEGSVIPEPASLALVGSGVVGLALRRRRV